LPLSWVINSLQPLSGKINGCLVQILDRIILAEVLLPSISPGEQIKETVISIYIKKLMQKNEL